MTAHAAAQIDEKALAPYLEKHVAGFRGLRSVTKFSSGQSNPTFRIEAESGDYVMRAKPPGELLKSAHQVDREYRVMSALANTDVPVPKMLHLSDETDNPLGRQFYIMEFLDGRVLWDPLLPDLSVEERAETYDQMNKVLAALHDVDPAAVGLSDFGRPGSYFERQFGRWTKQYRASETETVEDMDALIKWLDENMPEDDGVVSLVHGDYRLDNVMYHKTEPRIIAVLDWELSTQGHPFGDLGYQCAYWRLPNGGSLRGLGNVERGGKTGLPDETEYVTRYCERRGIDFPANWEFYVAFSFFRYAAIIQGVYKRGLDGNASDPEGAIRSGKNVPLIARLAVEGLEANA
ncbi:MAG: phosphotransferase [Pseudomonadota bacterium]